MSVDCSFLWDASSSVMSGYSPAYSTYFCDIGGEFPGKTVQSIILVGSAQSGVIKRGRGPGPSVATPIRWTRRVDLVVGDTINTLQSELFVN